MGDQVLDDEELEDLRLLAKHREGDSEQLIAFRVMASAMVKMVKSQRDVLEHLDKQAISTAKCDETLQLVTGLVGALAPENKPKRHISLRVERLEETIGGWKGLAIKVFVPVVIAAMIGSGAIAWKAMASAAVAQQHAEAAVKAQRHTTSTRRPTVKGR